MYEAKKVGERLKHLRRQHEMTQIELAELLYVSVNSVSGYETGKVQLGHDHISFLCDYFNISADYFYFGITKPLIKTKENGMYEVLRLLEKRNSEEVKRAYEILKLVFQKG